MNGNEKRPTSNRAAASLLKAAYAERCRVKEDNGIPQKLTGVEKLQVVATLSVIVFFVSAAVLFFITHHKSNNVTFSSSCVVLEPGGGQHPCSERANDPSQWWDPRYGDYMDDIFVGEEYERVGHHVFRMRDLMGRRA